MRSRFQQITSTKVRGGTKRGVTSSFVFFTCPECDDFTIEVDRTAEVRLWKSDRISAGKRMTHQPQSSRDRKEGGRKAGGRRAEPPESQVIVAAFSDYQAMSQLGLV